MNALIFFTWLMIAIALICFVIKLFYPHVNILEEMKTGMKENSVETVAILSLMLFILSMIVYTLIQ